MIFKRIKTGPKGKWLENKYQPVPSLNTGDLGSVLSPPGMNCGDLLDSSYFVGENAKWWIFKRFNVEFLCGPAIPL